MVTRVLVVEDSAEQRDMVRRGLSHSGYMVSGAVDAGQALEMAQGETPDLFIIGHCLPGLDGFSLCASLKADPRFSPILRLIISADSSVETQVKGLLEYVDDYLIKPFDFKILTARMEALLRRSRVQDIRNIPPVSIAGASNGANGNGYAEEELLGSCHEMQNIISTLKKYSRSDAPVLIQGESGTGKEITARTIHMQSARRNGPFVPINCGAIPENLIEAELFGYERGAFTGAFSRKKGKVEMAHGGTLFLDEVADLSPSFQVKFLRFLEDFLVERIGGIRGVKFESGVRPNMRRWRILLEFRDQSENQQEVDTPWTRIGLSNSKRQDRKKTHSRSY